MQAKIDGKLRRWRAVLHPLALHGALLPVSQLHARLEEEEEKEEEEEEEGGEVEDPGRRWIRIFKSFDLFVRVLQ